VSAGDAVEALVADVAAALQRRGWQLATAESCTGGGIAAACTDRAGSSAWFDRGFVTYSNAAKRELLGVPEALLEAHGAVSAEVAAAMAAGALARSDADVAVAVTGVAGPTGGSADKPVGTVWIAAACRHAAAPAAARHRFDGDRRAVRAATVEAALGLVRGIARAAPAST
jgi:nicotinamide-nucleotide amidase